MRCLPVRIDEDEVIRIDVFARHFHASRAEVLRAVVRLGIATLYEEYKQNPSVDVLLKYGSGGAIPEVVKLRETLLDWRNSWLCPVGPFDGDRLVRATDSVLGITAIAGEYDD